MSDHETMIPSGSQTVGPYFTIGLRSLADEIAEGDQRRGSIELTGKIVDRDGAPVPDAMLELWGAEGEGIYAGAGAGGDGIPAGFHRLITDENGRFSAKISKPVPVLLGDGRTQAPHFLVLLFARGLLRHLITRLYFEGEEANDSDPVLLGIPEARRHTLVAKPQDGDARAFHWDVVLQGNNETAFFAW